jgi:hypothetical protein
VVDHFTKQALFISTHDTITSAQLAKLFIIHVFSKHGVLSHITSDQGSKFVSHFFRSLGKTLNIKLNFTLGYHPECDRQMERINQTLEQYLQIYCNFQQNNCVIYHIFTRFFLRSSPISDFVSDYLLHLTLLTTSTQHHSTLTSRLSSDISDFYLQLIVLVTSTTYHSHDLLSCPYLLSCPCHTHDPRSCPPAHHIPLMLVSMTLSTFLSFIILQTHLQVTPSSGI